MSAITPDRVSLEGHVSRGFEAVRDAFEENFVRRGELVAPAAPTIAARKSSISGAVFGTRRPANPGSVTRWSSSTRPRRGSPP